MTEKDSLFDECCRILTKVTVPCHIYHKVILTWRCLLTRHNFLSYIADIIIRLYDWMLSSSICRMQIKEFGTNLGKIWTIFIFILREYNLLEFTELN